MKPVWQQLESRKTVLLMQNDLVYSGYRLVEIDRVLDAIADILEDDDA